MSSFVAVILALLPLTAADSVVPGFDVDGVTAGGGGGFSTLTCSAIFEAALMAAGPSHTFVTIIHLALATAGEVPDIDFHHCCFTVCSFILSEI